MFAWVDVETTGLDPRHEKLLEVALVITDDNLDEVACAEGVIRFTPGTWVRADAIDPYVVEMHTKSGLWKSCGSDGAELVNDLEDRLVAIARAHFDGRPPMCGSTVSFDRAFLREFMPRLEAMFGYRHVDVSSLGELASKWYPSAWAERPRPGDVAHRAMPDIRGTIGLMRYWRRTILL